MRCSIWALGAAACASAGNRRAGRFWSTTSVRRAGRFWIRVASKYPVIARDYFYEKKHQTVDIIKLNGSVELGPIVGLSDVIVDIVETGGTLRENGLEVLEEICSLSARMIVNPVSMQLEKERIQKIIMALRRQPELLDVRQDGRKL